MAVGAAPAAQPMRLQSSARPKRDAQAFVEIRDWLSMAGLAPTATGVADARNVYKPSRERIDISLVSNGFVMIPASLNTARCLRIPAGVAGATSVWRIYKVTRRGREAGSAQGKRQLAALRASSCYTMMYANRADAVRA